VTWYRLLLSSKHAPRESLRTLRDHVADTCMDKWGKVPSDTALFARYTDRGGYEVRFTERLHFMIAQAAPRHYIEACDPPRGWNKWSLQVGSDRWPDELGIRPAGW